MSVLPRRRSPRVLALVYEGLCTFEFACVAEVFGLPRPEFGAHWYRFETFALSARPLKGQYGLRVQADGGIERCRQADLIVIPGWRGGDVPVPGPLIEALRAAHARGATLVSICSGAYVLAATGLLDGARATTHWRYAEDLQRRYPGIEVDPAVLYVDAGRIMTAAGSAAGLDLCLHLVRRDFGPQRANQVACRLVIAPHRDGGQAQFLPRSVQTRGDSAFARVLEAMRRELGAERSVVDWAQAAAMSERSFLRRFREATGLAPSEFRARARIDRARELLEGSAASIERIAADCGLGSAANLRQQFRQSLGLSPSDYRRRFRGRQ
jgi:AraC family transcriptional activator FtrA